MSLVIGVAPGSRHTGVVLRSGDTLHTHHRVDRADTPLDWYLADVVDTVTKTKNTARNIALLDAPDITGSAVAGIAIPDPVAGWEKGMVSAAEMIVRAQIVGAVAGHWPTTRILDYPVDRQALTFYPPILQAHPDKILRDAWDLAAAGAAQLEVTP